MKEVIIYTDGGAVPNPGRGGYGVVLRFGQHARELSGGFELTTNNRMELMAVIVGLEALKEPCNVKLHSDSKYIVDAINGGSAMRWRANDWRMKPAKNSKQCKNPDLWSRLLSACDIHEVEFIWVKGHVGIRDNERCDELAANAMTQINLLVDEGYDPQDVKLQRATSTATVPKSNTRMTAVGQPCRKCQTPIVKKTPKKKKQKPGQSYYYAWYLFCPTCKSMYLVEEAKCPVPDGSKSLFDE